MDGGVGGPSTPGGGKVYALAPERYTQLVIYCLASFMCPMMWSILVRGPSRRPTGAEHL